MEKRVLLLSAGNPCRAIVAEALVKRSLADDAIEVIGAGVVNNGEVNDYAIQKLSDEGIDISSLKPRELNDVLHYRYDLVITLCDHSKEQCPVFPHVVSTIHMGFPVIDDDKEACEALFTKIKTKLIPLIHSELA